jgi:hypothetical protein
MKKFKIGLCFLDDEENVIIKKLLHSHWSVDVEKDLTDPPKPLVRDEIARVLLAGIKLGLTAEIIREMLDELKESQ